MAVKIGKATFSKHELSLLLLCLCFFCLIFFGSFKFGFMGKVFPLIIGGPGMVLVGLYLISGFLPPRLHDAMKKDTEFRLFGLMPEKDEEKPFEETLSTKEESFRVDRSYSVLALSVGYFFFSYLFGFYISTFIFTASYLFIFSRNRRNLPAIISNILLLAILMAVVYVFDYSFGYDFSKAAISKLF